MLEEDRELILSTLETIDTRAAAREQEWRLEKDELRGQIGELETQLEAKENELELLKKRNERDDQWRDERLQELEKWKRSAAPYIEAIAAASAPKVAEINRPTTKAESQDISKATAQGEMRGAQIKAILSSIAASGIIGVLIASIAQNCSSPMKQTSVPVPTVPPAGTGFAGTP